MASRTGQQNATQAVISNNVGFEVIAVEDSPAILSFVLILPNDFIDTNDRFGRQTKFGEELGAMLTNTPGVMGFSTYPLSARTLTVHIMKSDAGAEVIPIPGIVRRFRGLPMNVCVELQGAIIRHADA